MCLSTYLLHGPILEEEPTMEQRTNDSCTSKQQEQLTGHGSICPPWIRWFILESRLAIGSSSRRLRKGEVVDDTYDRQEASRILKLL